MEIILLQDVDNLGGPGKIVKVADGYGRNFLLPKKFAVPATPGNLKMLELRRGKLLREDAKHQAGAELLEDEKKFIDLANSPLWFGDEFEVVS